MICKECQQKYDKWLAIAAYENHLCLLCNEWHWRSWEKEEANNLKLIDKIQAEGHPRHCACRQVWGDGECECDLYEKGYDPYAWMKNNKPLKEDI